VPVDRTYVAENDAERERLRALVGRLGDQDLARPMEAGWTVAAVLAHVALWDQRILVLLDEWERRGSSWTPPVEDARDVDWVNDAARSLDAASPSRFGGPTRRILHRACPREPASGLGFREDVPEVCQFRGCLDGGPTTA
jgi:hypothetical protein